MDRTAITCCKCGSVDVDPKTVCVNQHGVPSPIVVVLILACRKCGAVTELLVEDLDGIVAVSTAAPANA